MVISMDFSEEFIRIIFAENSSNKLKIKSFFEIPLGNSYINNGYILNKTDLTLELSKVIEENNFKNKECFLILRTSDIISKDISLPKTSTKNLEKMIYNQLPELFSNNLNNYYIDYSIVEEFVLDKKSFYKLNIYGLPKNLVDEYRNLILNIGLKPKGLDISRSCIKHVLKNQLINGKKITAKSSLFIELNKNRLSLNLISNGFTAYKRTVNISEERKREVLFKENNIYEENSLAEVAVTKEKTDEITFLNDDTDEFYEFDLENTKFISPLFLKIEEEIYKIIQFSMSLDNNNQISKVFIYGEDDNIEEVVNFINENLNIPCQKISQLSNLKFAEKEQEEINIAKFFICISNILRK